VYDGRALRTAELRWKSSASKVGTEALRSVNVQISIWRYLRPSVLADVYRLFRRTCCQTTRHQVPENSTLQWFHKAIERQYFITYGGKKFRCLSRGGW